MHSSLLSLGHRVLHRVLYDIRRKDGKSHCSWIFSLVWALTSLAHVTSLKLSTLNRVQYQILLYCF